jgi:hypothetical protein
MSRLAAAIVLSLVLPTATAATFNVTRFDDPFPDSCLPSDCSLREAVRTANQTAGADLVLLPAGEFTLDWTGHATGEITIGISDAVTIRGAGAAATRVNGAAVGRLFYITNAAATFERLTMRGGRAQEPNPSGGGIRAYQSKVTLLGAVLTGNRAHSMGGGIDLSNSTLDLIGSEVSNNQTEAWGGGIYAYESDVSLRKGSVVSGNASAIVGGGIVVSYGDLLGDDTSVVRENRGSSGGGVRVTGRLIGEPTPGGSGLFEITRNSARGSGGGVELGANTTMTRVASVGNEAEYGGGVSMFTGTVNVSDSLIAANAAHTYGGGVTASNGILELDRVSIEGNDSDYQGGAMRIALAQVKLRNVDIHDNRAPQRAGIANHLGTLELRHTTISGNLAGHAFDTIWLGDGGTASYANSILAGRCTGATAGFIALGRNLRTTSLLGYNCSGTTATAAQLALTRGTFGGLFDVSGTTNPTSVLIDQGSASYCLAEDVRNVARDARCDIGAFEF